MLMDIMTLQNSEWDGLSITDPFNTPEAVVQVYIDGISSLGENVSYPKCCRPCNMTKLDP